MPDNTTSMHQQLLSCRIPWLLRSALGSPFAPARGCRCLLRRRSLAPRTPPGPSSPAPCSHLRLNLSRSSCSVIITSAIIVRSRRLRSSSSSSLPAACSSSPRCPACPCRPAPCCTTFHQLCFQPLLRLHDSLGCPAAAPARLQLCSRLCLHPLLLLLPCGNVLWDVPLSLRGRFEGAGQCDGCCLAGGRGAALLQQHGCVTGARSSSTWTARQ